eukprot:TRINITY_DN526_c0_g1_i2.p1 TRINITY_DN526_c0_g1~~TRINITY_DN526_c0_g1_i2.p1  ORF type:complete len:196 (-),score=31.08 TRINITY_DN526_c0_g1_i2:26-613(-)
MKLHLVEDACVGRATYFYGLNLTKSFKEYEAPNRGTSDSGACAIPSGGEVFSGNYGMGTSITFVYGQGPAVIQTTSTNHLTFLNITYAGTEMYVTNIAEDLDFNSTTGEACSPRTVGVYRVFWNRACDMQEWREIEDKKDPCAVRRVLFSGLITRFEVEISSEHVEVSWDSSGANRAGTPLVGDLFQEMFFSHTN